MRMPWIEAFAIVASYMVLSTSPVYAATLRTFGPTGTEVGTPISLSPDGLVTRDISADPSTLEVSFGVSNSSSSVSVLGVWLYLCGDADPSSCISGETPVQFSGNAEATYAWSDISSGNPGTASLLYFVKLIDDGAVTWSGYRTVIEKTQSGFTVNDVPASEVDVYANDAGLISTIREFVKKYQMVPMNPDWVSRVALSGASSLLEIGISGEASFQSPQKPGATDIQGSEIASPSNSLGFVFGRSTDLAGPVTIYLNPGYTCGMFGCETGSGEGSDNCCLDCGCSDGYYCDGSYGCMTVSGIGLSLFGTVSPKVSNCYESHVVTIPVQVINPPSGYSVSESWCKLGGSVGQCQCTGGSGNVYVCDVSVPPADDCGSGDIRITGNSVKLKIDYMNGASEESKYVETVFPDVTVGSYTCGQDGCESGLGESPENCCLDCGCYSGYCDYLWGEDPVNAACSQDPAPSDFSVVSMEPSHFDDHDGSDYTDLNIVMSDKPKDLEITGVECSMGCEDTAGSCYSSCSVDWSQAVSSDSGKLNLSVRVGFGITGYDPLNEYTLSPELTFSLKYRNGTDGFVEESVTKTFNQISIGAHWCGDLVCGQGETSSSCCFDCGCPDGQYCDTQSIEGPTQGDECRTSDFGLMITGLGPLELSDSSVKHDVSFSVTRTGIPSGASIVATCSLAGDQVPCEASCLGASGGGQTLNCTLTVPAMDYVDSPFFDSASREITLSQSSLNVTMYYNNGNGKGSVSDIMDLGNVVVKVTSHCGEGSGDPFTLCEASLGEDESTCCRDCGCGSFGEGYVCYQGANPNGECIDSNSISLLIDGYDPSPPKCVIGRIGGDCKFIQTHVAEMTITNSPPDLRILKASYSLDNGNLTDMNCAETEDYGKWDCAFVPDQLEGSEGHREMDIGILFQVGYEMDGTDVVDNLSVSGVFDVSMNKSKALVTCEEEIESIRNQIQKVKSNQASYNALGLLRLLLGAAKVAIGWWLIRTAEASPNPAHQIVMGWIMIGLGTLEILVGLLGQGTGSELDLQLEQLEDQLDQKVKMCSSTDYDDLAEATEGVSAISPVVYQQ